MRARIAEKAVPVAIAGRIRWESHGQKPLERGTYPMAGSHPSWTAKTRMSRIASQKSGMLSPKNASTVKVWSHTDPRLTAERIPAGTANSSAIRNARLASASVLGMASLRMRLTATRLP